MTPLVLAMLFGAWTPGLTDAAQPVPANRCVVCHLAAAKPSARAHLAEWSQSMHAKAGVTCERCHGGDPSAVDLAAAHRGVVASRYPASRVSSLNLAATCGACHTPELDAFSRSAHYALVERSVRVGPVCRDCHGAAAAVLPDPEGLERRCARCHVSPSAGEDRPRLARQAVQDVAFLRAILQRTARHIEREPDLARYERLQREQREARGLVTSAVGALHAFNLRHVSDRLVLAREAAEALLEQFEREPSPLPGSPAVPRTEPIGHQSLMIRSVYGPDLFGVYCSTCHGRDAAGHGSAAVRGQAADLTTMSRRNGGRFPQERVSAILSGHAAIPAHRTSAMPVWGTIFQALDSRDRWTAIRIENLVAYLESIQRRR